MPQKPTMPSPHMKTVDANSDVTLSCLVNSNDVIAKYEFNYELIKSAEKQSKFSETTFQSPKYYIGQFTSNEKVSMSYGRVFAEYIGIFDVYSNTPRNEINQNTEFSAVLVKTLPGTTTNNSFDGFGGIEIDDIDIKEQIRTLSIEGEAFVISKSNKISLKGLSLDKLYISGMPDGAKITYGYINEMYLIGSLSTTKIFDSSNLSIETLVIDSDALASIAEIGVKYRNAKIYNIVVVDNLTDVPSKAFQYFEYLKSVSFLASAVKTIGFRAFNSCKELETIYGISNLETIEDYAFNLCFKFRNSMTKLRKVTTIGEEAFANTGIESIVLTDTVTTIGRKAFAYCNFLKEIHIIGINDSLTVYNDTFYGSTVDNVVIYRATAEDVSKITAQLDSEGIKYDFKGAEDGSFTNTVYGGRGGQSVIAYTLPAGELENDGEYKWTVKLTDNFGKSITSTPYYFRTASEPNVKIARIESEETETLTLDENGYLTTAYKPLGITSVTSEDKDGSGNKIFTEWIVKTSVIDGEESAIHTQATEEIEYLNSSFELNYIMCGEGVVEVQDSEGNTIGTFSGNYNEGKFSLDAETDLLISGNTYTIVYDCLFPHGGYTILYTRSKVDGVNTTFNATYSMSDISANTIPISTQRWKLYLSVSPYESVLIDDTDELHGSYLEYTYKGFIPGREYTLSLEVRNIEGMTTTDTYTFMCEMNAKNSDIIPEIKCDTNKNSISINLSGFKGDAYYVIREDMSTHKTQYLDIIPGGMILFDYSAASKNPYRYYVIENEVSGDDYKDVAVYKSEIIVPEWDGISLIGFEGSFVGSKQYVVDEADIWYFELSIEIDKFTQNTNQTEGTSLNSRYGKISKGQTDYFKLGFSALLGDVSQDGGYCNDDIQKLDDLRKFIASAKSKLFVDSKGHVLICETSPLSYIYSTVNREQQTTVTISLTEIASIGNISIIGYGGEL